MGASRGAALPGDVVLVFILPPSLGELQRRLQGRNTDAAEAHRVAACGSPGDESCSHYGEYDYVIVNDDLDRAYAALRAILISPRATPLRAPMRSAAERGAVGATGVGHRPQGERRRQGGA